jgi:hypothetical protein
LAASDTSAPLPLADDPLPDVDACSLLLQTDKRPNLEYHACCDTQNICQIAR